MKNLFLPFLTILFTINYTFSQDTFSIVAVDSITGEVGSAGASCVDLFQTTLPNDDFLGHLLPGVGAINTQASYLQSNQYNASGQMDNGQTPSQIIQWLIANDATNQPQIRQYGIAGFVNGVPQTAAHTGSSTLDYKGHIVGPNYSIQGNILLGPQVLDSMEARFLNTEGDLACKLMAALQGANIVGADSRCSSNGTSSLFAFVKVAQPTDLFGSPTFSASVRTSNGAGIEPIDSLQTKFDLLHSCITTGVNQASPSNQDIIIFPNPSSNNITLETNFEDYFECSYSIIALNGKTVLKGDLSTKKTIIDISELTNGSYLLKITDKEYNVYTKTITIKK